MTTLIARRFAATPQRTGSETWRAILDLIASGDSDSRRELEGVSGIIAGVIVSEILKDHPLVISGNGPRLRVYCVYGQDAVTGEDCSEDALSWNPTDGDWAMLVPCEPEDIQWMSGALTKRSSRIGLYDITDDSRAQQNVAAVPDNVGVTINVEKFKQS